MTPSLASACSANSSDLSTAALRASFFSNLLQHRVPPQLIQQIGDGKFHA